MPPADLSPVVAQRYRLLEPLGEGSMGVVYQGIDTQTNQLVAIKHLKPDVVYDVPNLIERFKREGEALRQLNHPNIVKVLDALEEDGHHYLVMEYISGGSLADLLKQKARLPVEQVLKIGLEIADALTRTHHQQIIHRDLKPANVLLAEDGTPRLTDFGLALRRTEERVTPIDVVVGTLDYLPPEAFDGGKTSASSDIWAFGVMLFEMLTGQLPFSGATLPQLLAAISMKTVPDLAALRPEAPAALVALIYRMLEKNPRQRIGSVRLIGAEMEAISRGGQIPSGRLANQQTLHSLPTQPTPLVGRQREVATVVSLLRQEEVRLVTLSGPGGMGKTRLSLQVAGDLLNDFEHGVFFVALAAITDPDLVIPTIASTLEVKEGGQSIDIALRNYLADRHLLLVLDNLEQVIQAAPQIGKLLVAPRLKLLTTSREVLRLRGEHDYKVPPLRLPDLSREQNSASLSQYEAVTLFIQRAKAAQSDFIITDQNALAVAEICVRLDGLPLAIELAAARLQMFTPQAMLGKLSGRLKMLTGGARDLPARQQTLRSTIDWSYNLLKLSEQTLFARLAVFQGGRTVEAVEAICGPELDLDVTDGLESLLNKSILQRADGPQGEPRFVMLETIREYAWERLRASGEAVVLQRRHAEYFTAWVEQIEPELRAGPTQLQWFERLEAEYANLRAALDWSLADGNVDLGLRLVRSVWRFWWRQSHWLEWRRWTTRAFEQLEQTSREVHAGVLMAVGMVRWVDQDLVEAKQYIGEALSLYRQLEDRTNIGWALVYLAWGSLGIADEYPQAMTLVEEGLLLFRELGDKPGVAQALNVLGELARANGDYDRAKAAYEECLEIAQGTGDQLREQMQFGNLAAIAQHEGDYERAERLLKRALALARNKSSVIGTLQIMAGVVGARGYPQRSARLIGASEALYESIGDKLQPNEQADHERTILLLREQLGDEAFHMLRAKGRALSLEQTIEYAFKDED